jgi:hypothetical protein
LELAPDEDGLSVYRVAGEEDAREVSVRFALTCRDSPRNVDYVAFPAELAEALGLAVAHVPSEELDTYLSERHHEILGLTAEQGLRLAAAILAAVPPQAMCSKPGRDDIRRLRIPARASTPATPEPSRTIEPGSGTAVVPNRISMGVASTEGARDDAINTKVLIASPSRRVPISVPS